jgi:hypothetical protein
VISKSEKDTANEGEFLLETLLNPVVSPVCVSNLVSEESVSLSEDQSGTIEVIQASSKEPRFGGCPRKCCSDRDTGGGRSRFECFCGD